MLSLLLRIWMFRLLLKRMISTTVLELLVEPTKLLLGVTRGMGVRTAMPQTLLCKSMTKQAW